MSDDVRYKESCELLEALHMANGCSFWHKISLM